MVRAPRLAIPREIKVLIAAAFVIALGFGLVAPVLPQFAQSFNVGVAASSVIVSAFAFTRLVFAPAGGALLEKFGERPVYIAGLLIVAASTAACAFAGSYWQLLIFRGLGGIGSTMFTISAMALIIRLAKPSVRGRVSSAYASSFLLGNIAGPLAGGLLAGFGLRVPFLVYAAALVVAAAVVAIHLKDARLAEGETKPAARPVLTVREALGDSAYRAALASSFANGWSSFGVRNSLLPLFAAAALSAGPEIAGISLTAFAVGTAVVLTFSGRLADSWGRRPLVLTGLAVNAVATAAIGFSTNVPMFLVVSVIAGMGTGLLNPAQQAAVGDVVGNDRSGGKVLATFQMASDSGAIVGPILAGLLADYLGFSWAFGVTGAIVIMACFAWIGARETLEPEASTPAPAVPDDEVPGPAAGAAETAAADGKRVTPGAQAKPSPAPDSPAGPSRTTIEE
jgi:DHA1 family multidrug resistance protein-like MFS transporter